jgi:hypothetical protein
VPLAPVGGHANGASKSNAQPDTQSAANMARCTGERAMAEVSPFARRGASLACGPAAVG